MKKLLLVVFGLALAGSAQAADILYTPGSGGTIAAPADGSGKVHTQPMVCDKTTPTNCAPVDTTKGLMTQNVDGGNPTLGSLADTASAAANATAMSMLHQQHLDIIAPIVAGTNIIGQVGIDQTTPGTTNKTATLDPCSYVTKINLPISQATSTQIISGTSAKKTYVCSMMLIVADAENLSITEGTGTVCATGAGTVMGGATAAAGINLVAGGGLTLGSGAATVVLAGVAAADNVCLLQSGTGRVAGVLQYVQN